MPGAARRKLDRCRCGLCFALMTAAAVFAVLWPLGRAPRTAAPAARATIYKDQLAEVERDRSAGLIAPADAEAAQIEISRRLSGVGKVRAQRACRRGAPQSSSRGCRVRAGRPAAARGRAVSALRLADARGFSACRARPTVPPAQASLETLVAQVEAHLEKNPKDGRGWEVLAPVLLKLGRTDDAVRAYAIRITYNGETAARRADLGEAIAAAAGGVVTAEAKAEFERALALDAGEVKARYFTGARGGAGRPGRSGGRDLARHAEECAAGCAVASAGGARAGPDRRQWRRNCPAECRATNDMTAPQRAEMIGGMVERLAARLKQNGDDVDGWLRLVRAYMVLGQTDKAKQAIADARQATRRQPASGCAR